MTVAPDGFERVALGVNNSIPGPAIEANWVSNTRSMSTSIF